jgi:hypothetical protein
MFLEKDEQAVIKDIQVFRFADQPNYHYWFNPCGIGVLYDIPEGRKLTIKEFHKERLRFLNETTTRLKKLRILQDFEHYPDRKHNITTGLSFIRISKLTPRNNETYREIMETIGIENYGIVYEYRNNLTVLYPTEFRFHNAVFISEYNFDLPIIDWYQYLALSSYNKDKVEEIDNQ